MSSDVQSIMTRCDPGRWSRTLAHRPKADLPFDPFQVPSTASLLFDATVYIDQLKGELRLPSSRSPSAPSSRRHQQLTELRVFGPPPVLSSENAEAYYALRRGYVGYYRPANIVHIAWIRELVDTPVGDLSSAALSHRGETDVKQPPRPPLPAAAIDNFSAATSSTHSRHRIPNPGRGSIGKQLANLKFAPHKWPLMRRSSTGR